MLPVINPADGSSLGEVHEAGAEDVDLAVTAASVAWGEWRRTPALERAKLLRNCAAIVRQTAR